MITVEDVVQNTGLPDIGAAFWRDLVRGAATNGDRLVRISRVQFS